MDYTTDPEGHPILVIRTDDRRVVIRRCPGVVSISTRGPGGEVRPGDWLSAWDAREADPGVVSRTVIPI